MKLDFIDLMVGKPLNLNFALLAIKMLAMRIISINLTYAEYASLFLSLKVFG